MKVTPSVAYPIPKIRVRDFRHVTTSGGHWFLVGEVVREVDLPVDSYLPGRELDAVIESREWSDLDERIAALAEFCREWGIPRDFRDRDLPGMSVVRPPGIANSKVNQSTRLQALLELGLVADVNLTSLESIAETDRLMNSLIACDEIFARTLNAWVIQEVFMTRIPVEPDIAATFNNFLAPFSRHVDFGTEPAFEPTVFNVMALQVSNDILEQVPVRNCASESCGRLFTRQRGGRGRTDMPINRVGGVKYCSRTCADNQAHLMKARRDKAKATPTKGGTK